MIISIHMDTSYDIKWGKLVLVILPIFQLYRYYTVACIIFRSPKCCLAHTTETERMWQIVGPGVLRFGLGVVCRSSLETRTHLRVIFAEKGTHC